MQFSPLVWDGARELRSDAIRDGRLEVLAELFLQFVPHDENLRQGSVKVSVRRHGKNEVLGYVEDVVLNEDDDVAVRGEPWRAKGGVSCE